MSLSNEMWSPAIDYRLIGFVAIEMKIIIKIMMKTVVVLILYDL